MREVFALLREDGIVILSLLGVALLLATCGVMIEALLFRALLVVDHSLPLAMQRLGVVRALFTLLVALFLLEVPIAIMMLRVGRHLESRLRVRFLEKIPRLGDRYFSSRLSSDMAQRAHGLRWLLALPMLGVQWLRLTFEILLIGAALVWLHPEGAALVMVAILCAVGVPFAFHPLLVERDLVLRSHAHALSQYYLDALLGLIPIRTHGAERALRRQHERLLVEWGRASMKFYRADAAGESIGALLSGGFAIWMVVDYTATSGATGSVLLLAYWALCLPFLGQSLAQVTQEYPRIRNRLLQIIEPLGAPEDEDAFASDRPEPPPRTTAPTSRGAAPRQVACRRVRRSARRSGGSRSTWKTCRCTPADMSFCATLPCASSRGNTSRL
jgi:ABC-type multidrug transport system fused ATPase/permease subunit